VVLDRDPAQSNVQEEPCKPFSWLIDHLVFPQLLRAVSMAIKHEFDYVINQVADRAGLSRDLVHIAPVKNEDRMQVKQFGYGQDPNLQYPFSAYLSDVLRCSYVCGNAHDMFRIWNLLQQDDQLTVVRLKNKASEGTNPFNLHLNVAFQPRCFQSRMIVEIQIHSLAIYEVKKLNHKLYEILRAPTASEI